jgi:hypothetical protein
MIRTLQHRALSGLAVIGSCLGVYVVLAIAFHWLIGPTVAKNPGGVVADQPPSAMATQSPPATFLTPSAQSELQPRFESKPQGLSAAAVPDGTGAVAKKTAKKQVTRKTVQPERTASRNPWNFDFGGLFNSRSRSSF